MIKTRHVVLSLFLSFAIATSPFSQAFADLTKIDEVRVSDLQKELGSLLFKSNIFGLVACLIGLASSVTRKPLLMLPSLGVMGLSGVFRYRASLIAAQLSKAPEA